MRQRNTNNDRKYTYIYKIWKEFKFSFKNKKGIYRESES